MKKVTKFTDYFVICTGESTRQIDAIQNGITDSLSKKNHPFMHVEGNSESGWVLIDLGGVIVHIFTPKERTYYNLEDLWSKAISVIRIQ